MHVGQVDLLTKIQNVLRSAQIGSPGLALPVLTEELKNRGVVDDARTVRSDPIGVFFRQTEVRLRNIAFKHNRSRQRRTNLAFPELTDTLNALSR